MKKIIAGSLLTVMISNNIVYANDIKNELLDINENMNIDTVQTEEITTSTSETITSIDETVTNIEETITSTDETVDDYDSLKNALNKSNIKINIDQDITLTENLEIKNNNIIINGNGHKLNLNNDYKIVVKGKGTELNNIEVENYKSTGISVYRTDNISLKNIKVKGNSKTLAVSEQSLVGIDIDKSTVIMKNISSENHRYSGIRLKNESSVKLEGGNVHTNDKEDFESVVQNGQSENIIQDTTKQYVEIYEKIDATTNKKNIYYGIHKTIDVDNFDELKEALLIQNATINITEDIILTDNIEITNKNITINGNSHKINLAGNYKFTVKSYNTTLRDIEFINYISNGLSVYRASNTNLSNLTFSGNDMDLSKEERSKVGIDIYESTVKIDNIVSKNHLYRGIQVRVGSTVDILSKNSHTNDAVHIQSIKSDGQSDNIINDTNGYYLKGTEKENNGRITIDYFSKVDVYISNGEEFIKNLSNSGNVLHIKDNIKLNKNDLTSLGDKTELVVNSNITIEGNGYIIDLNKLATITLKGNDIKLENLTIKNSEDIGINIYNSRDIVLDSISVEKSTRYGIFVNGSSVKLKDCSTSENNGGIMITRSRTLRSESHIDSYVEVIGSISHMESNINVAVNNLEMIDGYFQNNQFIVPEGIYNKYENDSAYKVLSAYYLDLFGIEGEERNKKYKEQSIDYMVIQTLINAQTHTEVKDEDGSYVRLVGDGVTDNSDNLLKLIEYATLHGKIIYVPAGVYKMEKEIDLSTINLPALSNFTIRGEENALTIFDASSENDRMLKLKNEEYKSYMNYININNIVFNNMGLEFNGPYKKGISLNNNVFMNGKYTREKNSSGNIIKATMEPYIIAKNTKYSIEQNIFLRGNDYPGRGISTYRSKDTTIKDNFFGKSEGISDASYMLPSSVICKLDIIKKESEKKTTGDNLKVTGSQGNFFTAINNERYDENINITNNYFNMDKTRNINSDFGTDVLISGISVAKDGQRRDHIIYSKGYKNLNIYGNYFEGMENGAAGGVKIRNGENAYIGSNHFKDVPLLTYIYGDLTKSECLFYNTTIYNNLFHQTNNFGGQGTGILYYQSYRDGDNLEFKVNNSDGTTSIDPWNNAFGDVKNFLVYKNKFLSDDRDVITISNRAKNAYENNQFLAYGNTYVEKDMSVKYNSGNFNISESSESDILSRVNSSYEKYKNVDIPLTPAKVDYEYLKEIANNAGLFYEEIEKNNQIGILNGQYSQAVADELKNLLLETNEQIKSNSLNQWDTNQRVTLIQEVLEKLKSSINKNGESPVITGMDTVIIKVGEVFDPLHGVTATDIEDGDLTDRIIVVGEVDTTKPGEYKITYEVTDNDNNTTKHIRNIIVEDENDSEDNKDENISEDNKDENISEDNKDENISEDNKDENISEDNEDENISEDNEDENIPEDNKDENINENSQNDELENIENPKTGDYILNWLLAGIMSLLAILIINRRKNK